jgi:hypothetical protein
MYIYYTSFNKKAILLLYWKISIQNLSNAMNTEHLFLPYYLLIRKNSKVLYQVDIFLSIRLDKKSKLFLGLF